MPRRSETKRNDFHPPLTSHRLPPRSAVRRGFPARHEAAAHGARVTLFGLLIAVICRRIIERRKGGGEGYPSWAKESGYLYGNPMKWSRIYLYMYGPVKTSCKYIYIQIHKRTRYIHCVCVSCVFVYICVCVDECVYISARIFIYTVVCVHPHMHEYVYAYTQS